MSSRMTAQLKPPATGRFRRALDNPPSFGQVRRAIVAATGEVRDRARHAQEAVHGTRGQLQQSTARSSKAWSWASSRTRAAWAAWSSRALSPAAACLLPDPRRLDARGTTTRPRRRGRAQLRRRQAGDFDVQVDAVRQWPGDPRAVALDNVRAALAAPAWVAGPPAGKGSIAATSWKRAGNSLWRAAREMVTTPDSSGPRNTQRVPAPLG